MFPVAFWNQTFRGGICDITNCLESRSCGSRKPPTFKRCCWGEILCLVKSKFYLHIYIVWTFLIRGEALMPFQGFQCGNCVFFFFCKTHVRLTIFKMNMITARPPRNSWAPTKLPLLWPALCSCGKDMNMLTHMLYFNTNVQVLVSYHNTSFLCYFILYTKISDGNIILSASLHSFHSCSWQIFSMNVHINHMTICLNI